jgi:hypothetical protein
MALPSYIVTQSSPVSDVADSTDLISTAVGKGAALIGINDAGGKYTSTTVEGALQELGSAGLAIGSPIAGSTPSRLLWSDASGELANPTSADTIVVEAFIYQNVTGLIGPTLLNGFYATTSNGGVISSDFYADAGSVNDSGDVSSAINAICNGGYTSSGVTSLAQGKAGTVATYGFKGKAEYLSSGNTYGVYGEAGDAASGSTDHAIYGNALHSSAFAGYFNGKTNTTGEIQSNGSRVNYNLSVYASGTAYTLTNSTAKTDFGTTDPVLTIDKAGTYLITAAANLKYSGATFAATQTASFKLRRTNNTAADLTNAARTITLRVITTTTDNAGTVQIPGVVYTTSNTDDLIELWSSLSAAPSAGSVVCDSAEIIAIRLY